MYPILFSIGKLNFYSYGLMIALGFIAATLIMIKLAKKESPAAAQILFDQLLVILLVGLVGARIAYWLIYPDQFDSFVQVFYIWQGGLVSFGGIITSALVAILIWRKNIYFKKYFDILSISFTLGWAFGRIGCFLNGCCQGIVSKSFLAINGRIPTQLFEAGWSLVLFAILVWLFFKKKLPEGMLAFVAIIGYCVGRFIIDFWRDEPKIFLGMNGGQLTSVIIIILIVGYLILRKYAARGMKNG